MGDNADLSTLSERDRRYLNILLKHIRVCANYRPKFGKGGQSGLDLAEFQRLYGADEFYTWMGLDSPLLYAAHRAAGGMTSVYRQIGRGCEMIIRQILQDEFSLTADEAAWTYEVPGAGIAKRKLTLDGRIDLQYVREAGARERVEDWLARARATFVPGITSDLRGLVFETRQGYKSKDSKRQNADISNAANAYAVDYLPVLVMLSAQLDSDISIRYAQARWLILRGSTVGTDTDSTYVFTKDVLGYDLAGLFRSTSGIIRAEIEAILESVLSPS